MTKQPIYLALLSCALGISILTSPPVQPQTTPIDGIVAVVDEDVILRSELDRAMGRVLQQFAASNRPLPSRDVLEKQVLDQLIMIQLQLSRAEETGIRISEEEVDAATRRVAEQAGMTAEQLRLTLQQDGVNWAQFRDEMRDEIATQRLRQRVANSRVNVTESEVDIFLASQDLAGGEYRLGHILIGVPEGASPEQVQAAREKAEQVYGEVAGGMDFATAAITYSDGQQALQGGDLGWRTADQIPTVFSEMIGGMQRGDVSRPVRSASGFHMITVLDEREQSPRMVEEYNAQHIMIEVTELVSQTDALNLVNDIHQRLLEGDDFAALAKEYSDDTSSRNLGGDMGWFRPDAFGQRVRQTLESLQDGEISQPFQTAAGWHILKRNGTREQDRTDEYVRNQARESLRQQKAQEEIELFLRQMRDEAYLEYRI